MKRTILAALLAPAVLGTAARAGAQVQNPLVGKWAIEYERGRRMENGETTSIMGKGTLTIAPSGDSLLVTFDAGPRADGTATPPATAGGRMTDAGAVFITKQTVQLNMNGEVQAREITLTWTLQASGDALTGTLGRTLPMMPEPLPPSPVKGTRVASP